MGDFTVFLKSKLYYRVIILENKEKIYSVEVFHAENNI